MILSRVLATSENANDPSGSVNAKSDKLVNSQDDYMKNMSNMMCGNKPKQESDEKRLYSPYPSDSRYGQQFINSRPNNTQNNGGSAQQSILGRLLAVAGRQWCFKCGQECHFVPSAKPNNKPVF